MINNAVSVTSVTPLAPASTTQSGSAGAPGFHDALMHAINRVETSATEAGTLTNRFLSGQNEDLHSVALASQRASLEFDMFLQVRNKIVQAYQEVMRMQL